MLESWALEVQFTYIFLLACLELPYSKWHCEWAFYVSISLYFASYFTNCIPKCPTLFREHFGKKLLVFTEYILYKFCQISKHVESTWFYNYKNSFFLFSVTTVQTERSLFTLYYWWWWWWFWGLTIILFEFIVYVIVQFWTLMLWCWVFQRNKYIVSLCPL